MIYCSEIHTCQDLAENESIAERDDLINEAFFMSEKKYPVGTIVTSKK